MHGSLDNILALNTRHRSIVLSNGNKIACVDKENIDNGVNDDKAMMRLMNATTTTNAMNFTMTKNATTTTNVMNATSINATTMTNATNVTTTTKARTTTNVIYATSMNATTTTNDDDDDIDDDNDVVISNKSNMSNNESKEKLEEGATTMMNANEHSTAGVELIDREKFVVRKKIRADILSTGMMLQFTNALLTPGGFGEKHWRMLYVQMENVNEHDVHQLFFNKSSKNFLLRKNLLIDAQENVGHGRISDRLAM